MQIEIRRASDIDKADVLRISSQVWDGGDYVPQVLDRWLTQQDGILWIAVYDGQAAGFSRMTFLAGNKCWMEGIRVDQAFRGKGVGKALTEFQVEEGFKLGFSSCGLSSYIENYESLGIIRSKGFEETAQFKVYDWQLPHEESLSEEEFTDKQLQKQARSTLLADVKIQRLTAEDGDRILSALKASETLAKRRGYLSYDWTFETFDEDFIKERARQGDFWLLEKNNQTCIFSLSGKHAKGKYKTVNFIANAALELEVLAFAIEEAINNNEQSCGYMALDHRLNEEIKKLGYYTYNDESQDVFVFEKKGWANR